MQVLARYYICVHELLYMCPHTATFFFCYHTLRVQKVYKILTLLEQARLPEHSDAAASCNSCNKLQQQLQEHTDASITLREALAAAAERHRAHAQVLAKQRNGVY